MNHKANIVIFVSLLGIFAALIFLTQPDLDSIEAENRSPNEIPRLNMDTALGGGFASGFEAYLSDAVGFRGALISASRAIEDWHGIDVGGVKLVAPVSAQVIPTPAPTSTPKPSPTPTPSPSQSAKPTDISAEPTPTPEPTPAPQESAKPIDTAIAPIQAGVLLQFSDRLIELYGFNRRGVEKYIETVNSYKDDYPEARVFSAVMPTAIEFIDEQYKNASSSERETLDTIIEGLDREVTFVDAYDILKEHSGEYIYFRSDHHWTALGAYYAYTVFCERAGFEPISIAEYEPVKLEGFLGFLYSSTDDPPQGLTDNPDTITYYKPKFQMELSRKVIYEPSNGKASYLVFMGGDEDRIEVNNPGASSDRTAVIIKDSYANAFIPWLAPHYRNIIVLDPRKFTGTVSEEMAKYENIDLIFFNYVFGAGMEGLVDMMAEMK